jgi:predicted aldo/keto reductase-like oxidoreductase
MIQRREFLHRGLMGIGAAAGALHAPGLLAAPPTRRHANDVIHLGPEKVKLSRLAMGTGTYGYRGSSNQTRQLGVNGISELFQFGYDNGLTFWDSADGYGSHPHLKEALKRIPRDRVAIMSKTQAHDAARMRADLDRFRKEIGTDYLDIVLLHAVREGDWTEQRKGAMEVLSEAKEKGIVRTLGISCHSIEALRLAAKTPWVEVDLARINPWGVKMDADPATVKEVLREMKRNGKGVIGMKIIGEGQMRHRVDDCLTHAMNLDCIDCFTIGAESRQELGDLIARIPKASQREWPT